MYQIKNQNMTFNPNPSYAAYQYNPMLKFQQPELQITQMQPQFLGIQGKVVQSESAIMANDVPMDGSVAFFPLQDMSAIVVKQWDANGTIRKTVYKPFDEQMTDSSIDDKKIETGLTDDVTKAITDKLDFLFGKIKELEDKLSSQTQRKSSRAQKESES